ncbi:MAG: hypothetical protein KC422_00580 [Trueperaceae bacterium]|nr:hypothetical protein [Trueperaceae bacterium]
MLHKPSPKLWWTAFFIFMVFSLNLLFLTQVSANGTDLDTQLRNKLSSSGVTSLIPLLNESTAKVELGRFLFFDPLLSGNRDVSCATCHHPELETADALALSIGVGGRGLGTKRMADPERTRVARNAIELFNRGVEGWHTMFWDNRIAETADGLVTPAGAQLPEGLDNILATQALFPVTSRDEMRGLVGDKDIFGQPNELANFTDTEFGGIWQALSERIFSTAAYLPLFEAAYPGLEPQYLNITHIANAIAAFEASEWTFFDSPFDRHLAGNDTAMSQDAKLGALLFYGEAGCSACHSGSLLTDQQTHNIGVIPLGPGKSGSPVDMGVKLLSDQDTDLCAFRTPPLRNVTLTGPWMHNGAFSTLEDVIWQHLDPEAALRLYDVAKLEPSLQTTVKQDSELFATLFTSLDPRLERARVMSDEDIDYLLAFLDALTSPSALDLKDSRPDAVPSGLAFD